MELTSPLIAEKATEYRETEPLYAVEQEHVDMLHGTFAGGEFGWRDVEWVVQWYFRRYLGAYPDRRRREIEDSVRDNSFEDVLDVLTDATDGGGTAGLLDRLTSLDGVDVPVASGFLLFMFPERYVVVDERVWRVLREAGELDDPYPDPPGVEEYLAYDEVCGDLRERFGIDAWTLYRGLWRVWKDELGEE